MGVKELNTDQAGVSDPGLVTLSSGVVLRVRAVSTSLFADLMAEMEPPKPPVVYIESKGREEENPDDPDYLAAKQAHQARVAKAMSDAVIVLGTELESLPAGFPGPGDPTWNAQMRALGRRFEGQQDQYLAWVKYQAGKDVGDYQVIWEAVGRQASVLEKDAHAAGQRFPGRARGRRAR